jgi:hypothetical protein
LQLNKKWNRYVKTTFADFGDEGGWSCAKEPAPYGNDAEFANFERDVSEDPPEKCAISIRLERATVRLSLRNRVEMIVFGDAMKKMTMKKPNARVQDIFQFLIIRKGAAT